jgi:hypothetical protein
MAEQRAQRKAYSSEKLSAHSLEIVLDLQWEGEMAPVWVHWSVSGTAPPMVVRSERLSEQRLESLMAALLAPMSACWSAILLWGRS